MPRRRRAPPPPSPTAHAAVLLAIDPGEVSGWAVFVRAALVASSTATNAAGRTVAIRRAQVAAEQLGLPLVVVAEKWTAGGWASHQVLLGLGAAWGVWKEQLAAAGIPKRRIVRVYTQTWRARVIGGAQRNTVAWKTAACRVALANGMRVAGSVMDMAVDEAEAVCIGLWGTRAGEVARVLPKPRAPRKGKAAA